jgi:RNA polymerase sigma-70 factor (ECF subfamily)
LHAHRRSVTRESRAVELGLSEASAVELVRQLIAPDPSPSNHLARQESYDRLMAALAALSPRDREVLLMRHFEHLSTPEIAEALGLAEGASRLATSAP